LQAAGAGSVGNQRNRAARVALDDLLRDVALGQQGVSRDDPSFVDADAGAYRADVSVGLGDIVQGTDEKFFQATQVMGLQVAGVDLLESHEGPKVMEINSSPGFEGLEKATRLDIAQTILDYAVRYARRHGRGSWRKS
jgi:hypothetical protein